MWVLPGFSHSPKTACDELATCPEWQLPWPYDSWKRVQLTSAILCAGGSKYWRWMIDGLVLVLAMKHKNKIKIPSCFSASIRDTYSVVMEVLRVCLSRGACWIKPAIDQVNFTESVSNCLWVKVLALCETCWISSCFSGWTHLRCETVLPQSPCFHGNKLRVSRKTHFLQQAPGILILVLYIVCKIYFIAAKISYVFSLSFKKIIIIIIISTSPENCPKQQK